MHRCNFNSVCGFVKEGKHTYAILGCRCGDETHRLATAAELKELKEDNEESKGVHNIFHEYEKKFKEKGDSSRRK